MKTTVPASLLFALSFVLSVGEARAGGVPQLLTQQGRLLDASGAPVAGSVSLSFSIYAGPTGGAALWTETDQLTLDEGYFSVQLGSSVSFPPTLFAGQVLYLGVTVGADAELAPRETLASVPYALVAGDVNGAIHPTSVSVNGGTVINAMGEWVGPLGPSGLIAAASAVQSADITVMGSVPASPNPWQDVPGAALTLSLPTNANVDLFADGSINGVPAAGSGSSHCGFRFVVDGTPTGDPTWGDRLVGCGGNGNPYGGWWCSWSMQEFVPMASGQHTVGVQITGWEGNGGGCTSEASSVSAAKLRALAHQ